MSGRHINKKLYGDSCPSRTWLRICSWLELRGKGLVSYVPQVREEQMVSICLYVHVYACVALPLIVGAWSMAVMLWQLHEYYYYYYYYSQSMNPLYTRLFHDVALIFGAMSLGLCPSRVL